MEALGASSKSQSAPPYCGLPTQVLSVERAEKRLDATLGDGTSGLPLAYVSANHRCCLQQHQSILGKQLQPAEPEAVSRDGSSSAYDRDITAVNGN